MPKGMGYGKKMKKGGNGVKGTQKKGMSGVRKNKGMKY